jgi:hypothetical protein
LKFIRKKCEHLQEISKPPPLNFGAIKDDEKSGSVLSYTSKTHFMDSYHDLVVRLSKLEHVKIDILIFEETLNYLISSKLLENQNMRESFLGPSVLSVGNAEEDKEEAIVDLVRNRGHLFCEEYLNSVIEIITPLNE